MTKFIIFTDNDTACFPYENPFNILKDGNTFGNRGRTVGVISFDEAKMLLNPSLFIDAFKDYDLLILADKVFTDTAQYISYIKAFANGEQDIYVLIHKGSVEQKDAERKKYQIALIKNALGEDFENFEEQNHSSSSIYWNDLIEIAKAISEKSKDKNTYQKHLSNLKLKFPDRYKEAEINLRMPLRTLCKKIQSGAINSEKEFAEEIDLLKQNPKLKLVAAEIDKIKYENFRADCLSPQTV